MGEGTAAGLRTPSVSAARCHLPASGEDLHLTPKPLPHSSMTSEVEAAARKPAPSAIPLSLFALAIFYGGMVCIAGVLGNKQIALGPLAVEAGIFAFLLLVATSSAIAELHGA